MFRLPKRIAIGMIVSLLLIGAIWLWNRPASPGSGGLVFADGSYRICIRSIEGGEKQCLTTGSEPRWSPDGRQIAFVRETLNPAGVKLYLLNLDGANLTRLTEINETDTERSPSWSSSGHMIVFRSSHQHGGLFIVNIVTQEIQEILSDDKLIGIEPDWSPNENKVVFAGSSNDKGPWDIYLIDIDVGTITQLTDNDSNDVRPRWSPDGQRIVFEAYRDGNGEIYVMNADGSHQIRLTMNSALDSGPVWSPDGTKIAFLSDRYGRTRELLFEGTWISVKDIYVMSSEGTNIRRITNPLFALDFQDIDW